MTKTIKLDYEVHPYYCPNCYALYWKEVECCCPNLIILPVEENEDD